MKTTKAIRKYAAELVSAEEETLKRGLETKSNEFVGIGELYKRRRQF